MVTESFPPHAGKDGNSPYVDQVKRLRQFQERHPEVVITSPRQNDTSLWQATWIEDTEHPDDEGSVVKITNSELPFLLDHLEARLNGRIKG